MALTRIYGCLALMLIASLSYNCFTTLKLLQQRNQHENSRAKDRRMAMTTTTSFMTTTTTVMDPLEEELAIQLLYHTCHALTEEEDCQQGRIKSHCHWCPHGGVFDVRTSPQQGRRQRHHHHHHGDTDSLLFRCVPLQNPCHSATLDSSASLSNHHHHVDSEEQGLFSGGWPDLSSVFTSDKDQSRESDAADYGDDDDQDYVVYSQEKNMVVNREDDEDQDYVVYSQEKNMAINMDEEDLDLILEELEEEEEEEQQEWEEENASNGRYYNNDDDDEEEENEYDDNVSKKDEQEVEDVSYDKHDDDKATENDENNQYENYAPLAIKPRKESRVRGVARVHDYHNNNEEEDDYENRPRHKKHPDRKQKHHDKKREALLAKKRKRALQKQANRRKKTQYLTEAAKRNRARNDRHLEEFRAMSPEEQDRLLVRPQDSYYRSRYYSFVVAEEFKLIFIPIPKVACTQWLQLFRRMAGQEDWQSRKGGMPYTPEVNGLTYLADYPLAQANEMMQSPEWTRAVFVRDPKERFLSAYLDKVVNNQHIVLGACCRKTRDCASSETTFEEFYNMTKTCSNEHWDVQSDRVPEKIWQTVNFVGYMDNLEQDARKLLTKVGAWDKYAANGWGPNEDQAMFADEAGESAARSHATKAQARMRQYYTPEIEMGIEKRFEPDYQNPVFRLPRLRLFMPQSSKAAHVKPERDEKTDTERQRRLPVAPKQTR